jgi:hypothetical protein
MESTNVNQEYIKSLIQSIYSGPLTVSGSTSIIVKVDDRSLIKQDLYKKLDHDKIPYKDVEVGSSFLGTQLEYNGKIIKITYKNISSKGSGGGSEATDLNESAQCWYAAVAFNGYKLESDDDFHKYAKEIESKCKTLHSYDEISKKLTDDWIKSSIKIANYMKSMTIFASKKSNYTFYHKTDIVNKISKMFNHANKLDKRFGKIDKWNPADIWLATTTGKNIINNASVNQDWATLNDLITSLYESKDLIGISLKKVGSNVHHKVFNYGPNEREAKLTSIIISPKSMDGYLQFTYSGDDMKMQLRSFVGSWQGEIKGKHAAGGKIGGGGIASIMKRIGNVNLSAFNSKQIKTRTTANDPSLNQSILDYANQLGVSVIDPSKQTSEWRYSKFLTLEFLVEFKKLSVLKQHLVLQELGSYAASNTDTSSVFIKIS